MSNVVEMLNLERHERLQQKRKVCAYARVSTNKEIQETSLDLQIQTYTQMITKNPQWTFVGVFSDQGKSGTSIKYREQFNLMIELAKSENIDMIITKSISRFARNTIDCLSVIQELKEYNTEVWFEKENISSFDPKIEFVMSVLAGMAEEEARIISENVKWGVRKRFQQGQIHLVTSQVLGYDRDKNNNIIIKESEAKIVRKIYSLYLQGYSYLKIQSYLKKKGYKTKFTNIDYSLTSIRNILLNEKYTGNALLQKTARTSLGYKNAIRDQNFLPKYYVKNTHPAIVSESLWEKVQEVRKEKCIKYNHTLDKKTLRNRMKNLSIYNGFIRCPFCGKNYQYRINHQNKKYSTRMFYCASNRNIKKCESESLFANTFDEILKKHINLVIKHKTVFITELKRELKKHPEIAKIQSNVNKLEKELVENERRIKELKLTELNKAILNKLETINYELQKSISYENNLLLTTYNTNIKINKIRSVLNKYKHPIEKIDDFPFKQLFDFVIVRNRNTLEFVISFNNSFETPLFKFESLSTEYLIRKTKHITVSSICIN